jgi:hypothetical protein
MYFFKGKMIAFLTPTYCRHFRVICSQLITQSQNASKSQRIRIRPCFAVHNLVARATGLNLFRRNSYGGGEERTGNGLNELCKILRVNHILITRIYDNNVIHGRHG